MCAVNIYGDREGDTEPHLGVAQTARKSAGWGLGQPHLLAINKARETWTLGLRVL